MEAELLRWEGIDESTPSETVDQSGEWESYQDPITFEIHNKWVNNSQSDPDDPTNVATKSNTFACLARGVVSGGIGLAGNNEQFGDIYRNIENVRMWVPASVVLTKRDRITNIRATKDGPIMWVDEEDNNEPTVFNVSGVTPVFDAFNRHMENLILLERAA